MGNHVVSFSNNERQLFGLSSSGPILPIDDNTIVSRDGRYAWQSGVGVEVRDSSTGQVLWTDPTVARPRAFAPKGRAAVLVTEGNVLREVGPDASPAAVWDTGVSEVDLTYDGTGGWLQSASGAFVARVGLWAESPSIQGKQGTRTASGSGAIPEVVD